MAQVPDKGWVASWATAQPIAPDTFRPPAPIQGDKVVPAPPRPQSPSPIPPVPTSFDDETIRMTARVTIGGDRVRLSFSNPNGAAPVRFDEVRVALTGPRPSTLAGSDRPVLFGGRREVTLFTGALVDSDPIELRVPPLSTVAVSLYVSGQTPATSVHMLGLNSTTVFKGDRTAERMPTGGSVNRSYFWLTGISVPARAAAGAIVAFGDSITDGYATTPGEHRAWPELLAERLQQAPSTRGLAVLNLGVSGGRVLRTGAGSSALARFDRDVLARPGVKWVILLEGINDINASFFPNVPASEKATAEEIIEGYRQLVERAHGRGIKVMGATVLPTSGLFLYSEKTEAMRQALNAWIRTSGTFDAIVDFDAVTRDPSQPNRLLPAYDPGDHVHPNDAGNAAMANAIDLRRFR